MFCLIFPIHDFAREWLKLALRRPSVLEFSCIDVPRKTESGKIREIGQLSYIDNQKIVFALQQAENGDKVMQVCRKMAIHDSCILQW